MEYRRLGNSGLEVTEISLGGNNFGWWADEESSIKVIKHAVDNGINFIDTADTYDRGHSEEFIGKALKGRRSQVVIASKVGNPMGPGPNDRGTSRYHIMKSIDASLKRLQTDYIDLYQIHVADDKTPIEETLRALDDIVRAGKVRYVGCSNFAAWQLAEALWTSRSNNLVSFVTVQPLYNLFYRQIESELVPCCQAYNIGVIPWGPLAGGFLTGKYREGEPIPAEVRLTGQKGRYGELFSDFYWDKLKKLEAFAVERGHTVGELAIAWLLSKPWISTVIAGAKKTEQVSANIAASQWKLTAEEAAEVDKISSVE